jgi:hypothetical protein
MFPNLTTLDKENNYRTDIPLDMGICSRALILGVVNKLDEYKRKLELRIVFLPIGSVSFGGKQVGFLGYRDWCI